MDKKVGSVLVVGAGIGGMQSALDLANSGFKVYLLESGPSIGGTMAQLDKTFPTNDCSMCIMSPKMVDVGRHPNIELLTYSELQGVVGKEGNFTVLVDRKARSVDVDKCTGCGTCVENCPVSLQVQIPEKPTEAPKVREKKTIDDLIEKYATFEAPLIQILLDVNEIFRYLPGDVLKYLSYRLEIPLSKIYRVATFYKSFSMEMRGEYHIKICLGTACHVRGARSITDAVKAVMADTEDGIFSLEVVNCVGACALGPIIMVNDELHGKITVPKVEEIMTPLKGVE